MHFRRWFRLKTLKLVRLKGNPDALAKGIAIGVSVDFLPTFGFGVVFAYVFATIARVNRVAAIITSLALKWLIIPFYGANIFVGRWILGGPTDQVNVPTTSFFSLGTMKNLSNAFFLGSIINAFVSSIVVYYISRYFIVKRRTRKKLSTRLKTSS
jgi:uncharacterized protein (DUF2062 family)